MTPPRISSKNAPYEKDQKQKNSFGAFFSPWAAQVHIYISLQPKK
jgi:hypothetical protein